MQQQPTDHEAPGGSLADNALVSVDGGEPYFPAFVDPTDRWNGGLCPAFTRPAAERVVEAVNAAYDRYGDASERVEWDGDVAVIHSPIYEAEPGHRPERVAPDQHGRWSLGAYAWTWCYAPSAPVTDASGGETGEHLGGNDPVGGAR